MTVVRGISNRMLALRIGSVMYVSIVSDVSKSSALSETTSDVPNAAETSQTADETGSAGDGSEAQNGVRRN